MSSNNQAQFTLTVSSKPTNEQIAAVLNPLIREFNKNIGRNKLDQVAIPPTASVIRFAGATAPAGWLLCDGSAISRVDYAPLFGFIGTTYGAGDGVTTFNLPNISTSPITVIKI